MKIVIFVVLYFAACECTLTSWATAKSNIDKLVLQQTTVSAQYERFFKIYAKYVELEQRLEEEKDQLLLMKSGNENLAISRRYAVQSSIYRPVEESLHDKVSIYSCWKDLISGLNQYVFTKGLYFSKKFGKPVCQNGNFLNKVLQFKYSRNLKIETYEKYLESYLEYLEAWYGWTTCETAIVQQKIHSCWSNPGVCTIAHLNISELDELFSGSAELFNVNLGDQVKIQAANLEPSSSWNLWNRPVPAASDDVYYGFCDILIYLIAIAPQITNSPSLHVQETIAKFKKSANQSASFFEELIILYVEYDATLSKAKDYFSCVVEQKDSRLQCLGSMVSELYVDTYWILRIGANLAVNLLARGESFNFRLPKRLFKAIITHFTPMSKLLINEDGFVFNYLLKDENLPRNLDGLKMTTAMIAASRKLANTCQEFLLNSTLTSLASKTMLLAYQEFFQTFQNSKLFDQFLPLPIDETMFLELQKIDDLQILFEKIEFCADNNLRKYEKAAMRLQTSIHRGESLSSVNASYLAFLRSEQRLIEYFIRFMKLLIYKSKPELEFSPYDCRFMRRLANMEIVLGLLGDRMAILQLVDGTLKPNLVVNLQYRLLTKAKLQTVSCMFSLLNRLPESENAEFGDSLSNSMIIDLWHDSYKDLKKKIAHLQNFLDSKYQEFSDKLQSDLSIPKKFTNEIDAYRRQVAASFKTFASYASYIADNCSDLDEFVDFGFIFGFSERIGLEHKSKIRLTEIISISEEEAQSKLQTKRLSDKNGILRKYLEWQIAYCELILQDWIGDERQFDEALSRRMAKEVGFDFKRVLELDVQQLDYSRMSEIRIYRGTSKRIIQRKNVKLEIDKLKTLKHILTNEKGNKNVQVANYLIAGQYPKALTKQFEIENLLSKLRVELWSFSCLKISPSNSNSWKFQLEKLDDYMEIQKQIFNIEFGLQFNSFEKDEVDHLMSLKDWTKYLEEIEQKLNKARFYIDYEKEKLKSEKSHANVDYAAELRKSHLILLFKYSVALQNLNRFSIYIYGIEKSLEDSKNVRSFLSQSVSSFVSKKDNYNEMSEYAKYFVKKRRQVTKAVLSDYVIIKS